MPSGGMRIWAGLAILLVLTGCGGLADRIEFAGDVQAARDRTDRVLILDPTAFAAMPDSGSVRYGGHAVVVFGPAAAETSLLGQAWLTADFGSGQVSGGVDQVRGGTGPTDVQAYAGALTLDGRIGQRRANSFDALLTGTLVGGGQTLVLSGRLLGDFRGPIGQAVVAGTTLALEATLNGMPIEARVRLMAEQ